MEAEGIEQLFQDMSLSMDGVSSPRSLSRFLPALLLSLELESWCRLCEELVADLTTEPRLVVPDAARLQGQSRARLVRVLPPLRL
jgi:hypothetical protein